MAEFRLETYFIASRFESVNTYGLFAVMTTERDEILVEGSDDGQTWKAYDFKWKPGDLKRRPCSPARTCAARLGIMWSLLGPFEQISMVWQVPPPASKARRTCLAAGAYPFPTGRRAMSGRASIVITHDFGERRESGAWWRREARGLYCPALSLQRPD